MVAKHRHDLEQVDPVDSAVRFLKTPVTESRGVLKSRVWWKYAIVAMFLLAVADLTGWYNQLTAPITGIK